MSVFKIERNGKCVEVSKAIFDAYGALRTEAEMQTFWDNIVNGQKLDPNIYKGIPREPAVASSVEATLAQRGSRYGDFTDHAELCQKLKSVMMEMSVPDNGGMLAWNKLSDVQKQALEVIADKIARILTGDPNYDDNWHDIQGYAKLVEDRLPKGSN